VILILLAVLQTAPAQKPVAENPAQTAEQQTWTGCLQAGTAPGSYRLNLDEGTAVATPDDPASLGRPFLQLISRGPKTALTRYVGKHVTVTGHELSREEADQQAAQRPNEQEANETAAGPGGRPQRHLRYVRVAKIAEAAGACR
jgi:hypothetical protein